MKKDLFFPIWLALILVLMIAYAVCIKEANAINADLAAMHERVDALAAEQANLADRLEADLISTAEATVSETPDIETVSLGTYTVTAYCPCEICCGKWSNPENPTTASGTRATDGVTVGAAWDKLPAGTEIIIEGVGLRVVEDKPAKWIVDKYDGKIIDLYFDTHEAASAFGRQKLAVYGVGEIKDE